MKQGRIPSFARTGITSPLGLLDDKVPDSRIESAVMERFRARVAMACRQAGVQGKPAAEVVRDMVRVAALGPDTAARMYGEHVVVVTQTLLGLSDKPPS